MAASGPDLLATSGGELTLDLFPGDDLGSLTAKLNAWVAAGITLYTEDAPAIEYAYVQAYRAAIATRAGEYASEALKTGESHAQTGDQLQALFRLMGLHQDALDILVPGTVGGTLATSRAVRHVVEW